MDDEVRAAFQQLNDRLDHIEKYLVESGNRNGPHYTPTTGFGPAPEEVVELARAGKRKDAIIRYRALTGADFDAAAAAVDGL